MRTKSYFGKSPILQDRAHRKSSYFVGRGLTGTVIIGFGMCAGSLTPSKAGYLVISTEPQKIFRDDKALTVFNSQETYEKSSSATVCRGARCCLLCSGTSFGLLLPWTILPIFLPRELLPIPLSRALLSAPGLGCRRQWARRVLSLLVNGLLCAPLLHYSLKARAQTPSIDSTYGVL